MSPSIEKILSPKSGLELKATAIIVFGVIAGMTLFPYASGSRIRLDEPQIFIIVACVIGVVIIVMSDRITSLKIERGALDIKLATIKEQLNDTIKEVKLVMPEKEQQEKIKQAESMVNKKEEENGDDLLKEAEDIGKAMRMLREIMASYKN